MRGRKWRLEEKKVRESENEGNGNGVNLNKALSVSLMLGCLWGTSGHFSLQQDRKRNKWKCRNTKPQICQDFHSTQPEWLLCGCYDKHCRLFWNINTLAADSMSCLRWPQRTRQPHITTWPLARLTNLYHGHSWWKQLKTKCMTESILPLGKAPEKVKWGLKRKAWTGENWKCQISFVKSR